jgi:hypothetical protein
LMMSVVIDAGSRVEDHAAKALDSLGDGI